MDQTPIGKIFRRRLAKMVYSSELFTFTVVNDQKGLRIELLTYQLVNDGDEVLDTYSSRGPACLNTIAREKIKIPEHIMTSVLAEIQAILSA